MANPSVDTSEIRRKGRQRLIGAITIVLLLVVFVPMLLDPEPRQDKKDPVVAIPPKDNAPPLPAPAKAEPVKSEAPVAAPAPAAPAEAAAQPKAEAPKAAATVAPKAALADATKSSPPPKSAQVEAARASAPAKAVAEPKVEPPKAEPAKAAPKLEGFAIQVGAFGDEAKLTQAREKLAGARIPHFTERLPNGLTRLRAGPYKTREEAEKATGALKGAGLDGKVVPLP